MTTLYSVLGTSDIFIHHLTDTIFAVNYASKLAFVQNLNVLTRENDFWDSSTTAATFNTLVDPSAVSSAEIIETEVSADNYYDETTYNEPQIQEDNFIED